MLLCRITSSSAVKRPYLVRETRDDEVRLSPFEDNLEDQEIREQIEERARRHQYPPWH
jgi:hypothetical protein